MRSISSAVVGEVAQTVYRSSEGILAVEVIHRGAHDLELGSPKLVVSGVTRGYDVTPDGTRFLLDEFNATSSNASRLNVVTNWTAGLLAPKK